jgi:hypothetical protein
MPRRITKSFYLMEISVQPGGARRGELYLYNDPQHILAILRQEAALYESMWVERSLELMDILGVWSVTGETLDAFVDLRPFLSFRVGQGAPLRWEEASQLVEAVAGDRDLHVDIDHSAMLAALPEIEGELACHGDVIRLKKRRKVLPQSYVQLALEQSEALHYGRNDVEADDPPPEGFVDPDPPSPPADPLADDPDAELLRRIYAHSEDDAPREDYARALAARGDPRAELITLQLARARGEPVAGRRESQLLAKHAKRWGAPILDEVERDAFCRSFEDPRSVAVKRYEGVRFERGFLSSVSMFRSTIRTGGFFDHPAWATVRTIAWTPVITAAMRSIEDVGGPTALLRQLARLRRPLDTIRIGPRPAPWPGAAEPLPAVAPGALQIRRFIVSVPQSPAWIERIITMSPGVETIELNGLDPREIAEWDWSQTDRASALQTIVISSLSSVHEIDARLTLTRTQDGWDAEIVARGGVPAMWRLARALEQCFRPRPVKTMSFTLVGFHEDDDSAPAQDGWGPPIPRYHDSLTSGITERLASSAERVSVAIRTPETLGR